MAITRWDPFQELEAMNERLNRVFGRGSLSRGANGETLVADWAPSVDIAETPEEFVVKAELPEIKKEDIKVTLEGGVLRLSGERKSEKEEKDKRYHRVERFRGTFMRAFSLPDTVDQAKLAADYKDGVLTIRLPKMAPAKPATVDIKVT